MTAVLIEEMARLLASLQQRTGFHGSGRHIGLDMELCPARAAFGTFPARPCSPRCAAVQSVIEQAAAELGCSVEDLRSWPRPRRARRVA